MVGAGPGPTPGDIVGPDAVGSLVFAALLFAMYRITAATIAIATIASIAIPTGDTRKAKRLFGTGWTWNSTPESVEASWRFVHVAELEVVLLG